MVKPVNHQRIDAFDFQPGRVLASKYEVVSRLGAGWEGEVYVLREIRTGIERAAKFFFPHRNIKDKTANFYARKLHKLRGCPILIQYHTQEVISFRRMSITVLISEFVEGELLSRFLARQPGHKLSVFEAMHLLHLLASGVERIHQLGEYHGDLHDDNIIVVRQGISFNIKLIDMFHWGAPTPANILDDVCDLIRIFYDAIGGARVYPRQSPQVKAICSGLKRSLIRKKFRTAGQLRSYLESFKWD